MPAERPPAGTSAPATSAPAAAAPASGGAAPATINVIAWNSGSSAEAFKNAMSQINDKFKQKRSNVTINFETLGQGPTWTNAQMARIAGQTADVTATYGFAPQDIINFQPDTQFLDLSGLASIKSFDQTNVARNQRISLDTAGRRFRYYLLWITKLPPGQPNAEIAEFTLYR